jgi:hypothetical protein
VGYPPRCQDISCDFGSGQHLVVGSFHPAFGSLSISRGMIQRGCLLKSGGGWPTQAVLWLEWGCAAASDAAHVERTLLSVALDVEVDLAVDLPKPPDATGKAGPGKGTTSSRDAKPAVTWKSGASAPRKPGNLAGERRWSRPSRPALKGQHRVRALAPEGSVRRSMGEARKRNHTTPVCPFSLTVLGALYSRNARASRSRRTTCPSP